MAYTFKELKGKTVADLKQIAAGLEHEAVKGYTQMNKDHLLKALCTALGVEMHEHHEVMGLDKLRVKTKIKELKNARDQALKAHDHNQLKAIRLRIKRFKKKLRRAMV